jgi:hypothetical protein
MSPELRKFFDKLDTPLKIQDYLESLKYNFEPDGDSCSSPAVVIRRKTAHCIEGALLAYVALKHNGQDAWLLDLVADDSDSDHVVCLFKKNGLWGCLSKSNYAQLGYREPVYRTYDELAMSFFHEYINKKGKKTMISYSKPFSLKKYGKGWVESPDDLWQIGDDLDDSKHFQIIPKGHKLRNPTKLEAHVGNMLEWSKKTGKRNPLHPLL